MRYNSRLAFQNGVITNRNGHEFVLSMKSKRNYNTSSFHWQHKYYYIFRHDKHFLVNATCCPRLSVSSSGAASSWQPDKMGSYSLWPGGSVGGRRVWRHETRWVLRMRVIMTMMMTRQNYVYYWEWGLNTGSEWMIGHSPYSSERGIRWITFGEKNYHKITK